MKELLKVNIAEVPSYVKLAWKSKNNLLLVSDPGCGKSSIILGMENDDTKVFMFTGSSTYEETVNGIPYKDENGRQFYTIPSWLIEMNEWAKEHPKGMLILFLDEFNTADKPVMDTFKSILTERKVPTQREINIPENTVIVAAMNPQSQNAGSDFDRAHASRFMVLSIESTLDSYREYLKGNNSNFRELKVADEPNNITLEQKEAIIDQISSADFGKYEEGDYQEINARSLSNFFNACEYLSDLATDTPRVSKAFFGMYFEWKEALEKKQAERKEKIKRMSVYPNEEELREMSTEELEEYHKRLTGQSTMQAIKCKATCIQILNERKNKKEEE